MTLYQKIPTTSARVHPLAIGAGGVLLLSLVATAAIVGWMPDAHRAGEPTVTAPVPATAARASSASSAAAAVGKAGRAARPALAQLAAS